MKRALAACLALCALVASAAAQLRVVPDKTPAGHDFQRIRMDSAQFQSIQLLWKDGSVIAEGSKPGLAGAVQYLMARGPKGEKLGELTEYLRDYQAGFSVHVGIETSGITISAPPEHMSNAVAIIKRFIDQPALEQGRLDTFARDARLRSLQALRQGETQANQLRIRALLPDGPLRRLSLVNPDRLAGITSAEVDAWRRNTLTRNGAWIVTAGPMPTAEVAGVIDRLLADMPERRHEAQPQFDALRANLKVIVLEQDVPQTIIQAYGPTTIRSDFSTLRASMATQRLGGGSQGRLHAALRDRLGATYGASVSLDSFAWNILSVSLRTAVEHDKAAAVLPALREEYRKWWQDGVTEAEFAAVRSAMLGNRRANRMQPGTVAATVVNAIARGLPADYYAAYDAELEKITRDEVNAFIRAHFPKDLGLIIVAPSAQGLGADCVIQRLEDAPKCGL